QTTVDKRAALDNTSRSETDDLMLLGVAIEFKLEEHTTLGLQADVLAINADLIFRREGSTCARLRAPRSVFYTNAIEPSLLDVELINSQPHSSLEFPDVLSGQLWSLQVFRRDLLLLGLANIKVPEQGMFCTPGGQNAFYFSRHLTQATLG